MFEKRHTKLLDDAFKFMRQVGGAIEICDRGWEPEVAMDQCYMEDIQDLLIEWLPEEGENLSINTIDDCLYAEDLLEKFFRTEILEIMNK